MKFRLCQVITHERYGDGIITNCETNSCGNSIYRVFFPQCNREISNLNESTMKIKEYDKKETDSKDTCAKVPEEKKNTVDHPSHYNVGKIEVIDFIEDLGLGFAFNLGNAIKYLSRAGYKHPEKAIEDLEKAAWYCQRQITKLSLCHETASKSTLNRKINVIDYIEDKKLSYNIGRAIELISKASFLTGWQAVMYTLEKALDYIHDEIKRKNRAKQI